MTDFKNFMNDFSHLMSGMTSVAGGLKTEFEQNLHNLFADFATKSGFVKSDEFNKCYIYKHTYFIHNNME